MQRGQPSLVARTVLPLKSSEPGFVLNCSDPRGLHLLESRCLDAALLRGGRHAGGVCAPLDPIQFAALVDAIAVDYPAKAATLRLIADLPSHTPSCFRSRMSSTAPLPSVRSNSGASARTRASCAVSRSTCRLVSTFGLRLDVLWARGLVWVASFGRDADLTPDAHFYFA